MNNGQVEEILNDCKDDLECVKTIIDELGNSHSAIIYLNNYAVIRACGTMEVAFKSIIADFCGKESKEQVKEFLKNKIRKSSINPSYQNIIRTLKDFDKEWLTQFRADINAHPDKDLIHKNIKHLVDARNLFAHGKHSQVPISDTINYFEHFRKAIKILDGVVV